MFLGLPLAVWFGIMTFTSLFTTLSLGIATHMGKPVFKYHRFFAFTTATLALTHLTLVILLLKGILVI